MTKISAYTQLAAVAAGDELPIVDVSDTSMAPTGTTKRVTAAALLGLQPTGVPATDYANLQALLNLGGKVRVAPGTFSIGNNTLTFSAQHTVVEGAGWNTQIQWDATGGIACLAMADTTYRRIFIRDLRITQTSAASVGTAIDASYFQNSAVERVLIDGSTNHPNTGVSFNSASCFYNVLSDSRINCDGTSGVGVRFDSGANSNVVRNCRILPSASDSSQIAVYVNANTITLDRVDVEHAGGTAISLGSLGHACVIIAPYLESNGTHIAYASGVSNPQVIGGSLLTPTVTGSPGIADSGAIAPSTTGIRSGTATPYSQAIFQAPRSLGQIVRVINRTGSPTDVALRVESLNGGELAIGAKATSDTANRWQVDSAGDIQWGSGSGSPDCHLNRQAANVLQVTSADLDIATAGHGLRISEGTNGRMGVATLVGGTVTVSNTSVAAGDRIFLSRETTGGTPGHLSSTRSAGTSFTINSSAGGDTSTVAWMLMGAG